jgi:hypothetical protein
VTSLLSASRVDVDGTPVQISLAWSIMTLPGGTTSCRHDGGRNGGKVLKSGS